MEKTNLSLNMMFIISVILLASNVFTYFIASSNSTVEENPVVSTEKEKRSHTTDGLRF